MTKNKHQVYHHCQELKMLVLNIYFFGPQVYRFLKHIMQLPNIKTT